MTTTIHQLLFKNLPQLSFISFSLMKNLRQHQNELSELQVEDMKLPCSLQEFHACCIIGRLGFLRIPKDIFYYQIVLL
jgi:hypothetical protein